jgi:hypothetical protein
MNMNVAKVPFWEKGQGPRIPENKRQAEAMPFKSVLISANPSRGVLVSHPIHERQVAGAPGSRPLFGR